MLNLRSLKRLFIILVSLLLALTVAINASILPKTKPFNEKPVVKTEKKESDPSLCSCIIGVCHPLSKVSHNYVFDKQIYDMRCDTLMQVKFWRNIMNMNEDSCIINVATHRNELLRIESKTWGNLSDEQKTCFKDSVRTNLGLDSTHRILLTTGKKFFYDFDNAFNQFERGINCFIENGVDPWYAQSILLIESPNKLQKSNAGAYGPFQLMKDVARLFGLTVNRKLDERANFERSAYAASSLLKKVCIPKTKEMLDTMGITYNETDLWFRLLVMHSYHAGSGNVKQALKTFNPTTGDMNLIFNLWKAETRHFRSASQNYSQLVLAAHLEMNQRMKDQIFYFSAIEPKANGSIVGKTGTN
jgi:hypothetical protein